MGGRCTRELSLGSDDEQMLDSTFGSTTLSTDFVCWPIRVIDFSIMILDQFYGDNILWKCGSKQNLKFGPPYVEIPILIVCWVTDTVYVSNISNIKKIPSRNISFVYFLTRSESPLVHYRVKPIYGSIALPPVSWIEWHNFNEKTRFSNLKTRKKSNRITLLATLMLKVLLLQSFSNVDDTQGVVV